MIPRSPLVLLAAVAALAGCDRAAAPFEERDVLLVTLDTTRADHLGAYGYDRATSPFLDSLAERGVRFERAWAAAPLTLVSHASILTGLDPPRHGVRNNGFYRLPDELPTLATLLGERGWRTGAFVSALVLDARHGLARGFEHYDDELDPPAERFTFATRTADRTVARAVEWIAQLGEHERVFAWLHFFDPHAPYASSSRFGDAPFARYDTEIRAVDEALGELARALDGLDRDPLWVVTADHGEGLGEHGELTHGVFLYESTLRVPLLIAASGSLAPRVVERPARHVDILPTVLDLVGAEPVPGIDGSSLVPELLGLSTPGPPPAAYAESLHAWELNGWSPLFARIEGDWKYVLAPRPELYELATDGGETRNLEADAPERAGAMRAELLAAIARASRREERVRLDAAGRSGLAALGYSGSDAPALPEDQRGLPDPKDRREVSLAIEQALELCRSGRERAGLAILEQTVREDPENPALLRWTAIEALRLIETAGPERERLLERTGEYVERWRALRPEDADAAYSAGLVLELDGDLAGAERAFERVASTHAGHVTSAVALLELAGGRGDVAEIRTAADRVLARDPGHRAARHAAARSALGAGDHASALDHYAFLADTTDETERALVALRSGQCLQALGRHREALQAFETVPQALRDAGGLAELEAVSRRALAGE